MFVTKRCIFNETAKLNIRFPQTKIWYDRHLVENPCIRRSFLLWNGNFSSSSIWCSIEVERTCFYIGDMNSPLNTVLSPLPKSISFLYLLFYKFYFNRIYSCINSLSKLPTFTLLSYQFWQFVYICLNTVFIIFFHFLITVFYKCKYF